MSRIKEKFTQLKKQNHSAFIGYICAGDPDYSTSLAILKNMPKAGVDIIEVGVPFLDPAGDGPVIENAAKRAIKNGMSLKKTLLMISEFRKENQTTPIVLMTYFNPLLKYGLNNIFSDAKKAGVDGVLIVDLPLEEEGEVIPQIKESELDLIQLIAPTTNLERAKKIVKKASGFIYLISMLGITGTKEAKAEENIENLHKLRTISKLPIAIGFGIKTPSQAQEFADLGFDGVVVGSTFVKEIEENFLNNKSSAEIVESVTKKIEGFSND